MQNDEAAEMTLPSSVTIETSGTEGVPRKVVLSAEQFHASARIGQEIEDLQPGDCWLNCLSMEHVGGVAIAYRCRQAGATMIRHSTFDVEQVALTLQRHPVTHLSLVPVMLIQLLDHFEMERAPAALRTVLIGGDRLPKAVAARALHQGWPLLIGYGMTETASRITLLRLTEKMLTQWQPDDVGPPLPGIELSIGGRGEVRVRSEELFPGENREVVTGDRGEIDQRGHLHIHGRLDYQILSAGRLIDPAMVESQLLACPAIDRVAVTAVADAIWGSRIVAVLEHPINHEIEMWVQENIESGLRPRCWVCIEQLPYTRSGKVDRHRLQQYVA